MFLQNCYIWRSRTLGDSCAISQNFIYLYTICKEGVYAKIILEV